MSTDDGRTATQNYVAQMRIMREQRDELAEALRPFTEGLHWVTAEHINRARLLLAEVAR